ncbi:hypothetical protein E2C01_054759 [Portunus trituberculatus]|uniref:Uncharacterized protein n=1 Tax=Portunus trituberculatus TaxID=210409 RepID=A0A5B7GSX0_PORTR|nr:hypothetical protein [Portunus trituberculatus]
MPMKESSLVELTWVTPAKWLRKATAERRPSLPVLAGVRPGCYTSGPLCLLLSCDVVKPPPDPAPAPAFIANQSVRASYMCLSVWKEWLTLTHTHPAYPSS